MTAVPDPTDTRGRLVHAAARMLAEGGPDAVSVRKLAAEVGTSTMAVYTHFGGKPELLRAVTVAGFAHLADVLAEQERTDDPVADLYTGLVLYRRAALDDPNLFAVMFGRPVAETLTDDDERAAALATFVTLVDGVQAAMDAGRFRAGPSDEVALELWAAVHGLCTIELGAGLADADQAQRTLAALIRHLAVGLGDDPVAAAASIPD